MVCSQIKIKHYDNFQLTNFNTLRIKSIAKQFWLPDNSGELVSLLKKFKDKNPIVIGNGSNILFSSKGIDEPIIHTGNIKDSLVFGETIDVEAGIKTQTLSKLAYDKGLSGFEFLIGIPASLGGCTFRMGCLPLRFLTGIVGGHTQYLGAFAALWDTNDHFVSCLFGEKPL